ncbi:DNA-binding ATP-dependent protease La [Desulfosarcina cetonica]|uniref:endopeptidase La n=1 Tax=Desulfosarcina cetonica TaxID=90730 RepID=UPI0006D05FE1|nr:endopeptidase La [Desulfosarcina cetonica]VTR71534.1 DNA-binding ATP-dependent protease La [Desulfosarcina cetonica]
MVTIPKFFKNQDGEADREVLPLLPLRDIVVFPHMVAPLFVGRNKSVSALSSAMNKDKRIFLATQTNAGVDNPTEKDISGVGVIGSVLQLLRLPDGTVKALIEGKQRARIAQYVPNNEFFEVELSLLPDMPGDAIEMEALTRAVIDSFGEYAGINKSISKELLAKISAISDPSKLADSVASHFSFKLEDKQSLLETTELAKRLSLLVKLIKLEIEVYQMDQRIKGRVKEQMEKTQKNYYLNEQMRAIRKEMGADDEMGDELKELEKKIKRKRMSKEASSKVRQEFKKLKLMTPMSAEATVVRNYIDWIISLPWFGRSKISHDLIEAENILNEDHYGLEKPKERILEYLAVQTLVKKLRGPILCLVGPPGVGKTSLAKSIARATGRKFVRLSLGGVRDEAEIRGHRRTYIGAMPGKIIQSLKKIGSNNPVFCLDEVDKMSMDFRGDPSSALLEVLDPEQNYSFNDHYLDLDYDLSEILFVTTANTLPDIPLPLQDRMEIIRLPGYTELEKFNIANEFLIPKQIEANGLSADDITFSKSAIYTIIQRYTREAGVRNLEREISSICRKTARKVVNAKDGKKHVISANTVTTLLGPPPFKISQIEEKDQIGLVTGLAWTQVGGELLCVETLTMPGKGNVSVTGKLGDVMKESAQAAVSFVRSRAANLGIDNNFHKELDLHIHIPEGAIPKDGPSAGIAMCTSLVSALTRRPVRRDVAMTGEITLRGRVLPIGGLKEKLLAAHRGGIRKVLIPVENEKDLRDIPKVVTRQMKVVTVEHMDEVLAHALVLGDGERLFSNSNMPMPVENSSSEPTQPAIN